MAFFRKILYPFSILYGFITFVRNYLYDLGWFTSKKFHIPVIAVGNLAVGGTGKTPQVEYLVRLLKEKYKVAILSRGYKRITKGFIKADETSTALTLGDEPFQYFKKFKTIMVSVDKNRTNGIDQLLKDKHPPQIVLLDDAFQHRKVKAGLYVLLTSYDNLYVNDTMLPTGNLREYKSGAKRAQIIIVTKCPKLSAKEKLKIKEQLKPKPYQKVFFSEIKYSSLVFGKKEISLSSFKNSSFVLVTGIANPKPLVSYLKKNQKMDFEHLQYPDHHNFTNKDIQHIKTKGKTVITTEKDYVRLHNKIEELYYIEIEIDFLENKEEFNQIILNYVE